MKIYKKLQRSGKIITTIKFFGSTKFPLPEFLIAKFFYFPAVVSKKEKHKDTILIISNET